MADAAGGATVAARLGSGANAAYAVASGLAGTGASSAATGSPLSSQSPRMDEESEDDFEYQEVEIVRRVRAPRRASDSAASIKLALCRCPQLRDARCRRWRIYTPRACLWMLLQQPVLPCWHC
jgi:hypothetical protein